ncbi:MAG TPA: YciI family protein [Terriglobales bacterium]|nr:YciI family protein [Terriglobales bacterium]
MAKQHYFFRLIPPRPAFPHDMTDAERHLMEEHSRYFQQNFAAGRILLYGPVMAASGAFGLAVLEVESEEEARRFGDGDPSVKAGLNRFEISPMQVSGARAQVQ